MHVSIHVHMHIVLSVYMHTEYSYEFHDHNWYVHIGFSSFSQASVVQVLALYHNLWQVRIYYITGPTAC
jgi:hypothetical protein